MGTFHRLLLLLFYYYFILIKQYFLSPYPKPTPYRTLKVCIVTLSDKHHLLFLIIYSLMGTAGRSLQCQTFQVLLSLWGPNVALTSTHSHKHTLINIYADIYYFSTHKSHSDSNITAILYIQCYCSFVNILMFCFNLNVKLSNFVMFVICIYSFHFFFFFGFSYYFST